jgi:hypothetical protein
VLAITGDKGIIQGSLSQSSIYMHTAQSRGFQELWTIHMRSCLGEQALLVVVSMLIRYLVEGDCGSWVVDRENGLLYGQIVAGHPGSGVGYIIPASQIFEGVWQTLGDALILPSGTHSRRDEQELPVDHYSQGLMQEPSWLLVPVGSSTPHNETHLSTTKPGKEDSDFAYSRLDDISESIARHSLVGDKPRRGKYPYEESNQFDNPLEESSRYRLPVEVPRRESNRGKKRRPVIVGTPYEDPNDKAIARVLQRNEKDAQRSEKRDLSPVDPGRPVYTRLSRRHMSMETLRVHGIDYTVDAVSSLTVKKFFM